MDVYRTRAEGHRSTISLIAERTAERRICSALQKPVAETAR
jgi:hypothetical protein